MPIIREQAAKAKAAKKDSAKTEKNERDAAAGISADKSAEKKLGRKAGKVAGSLRDIASQHGVDEKTVRKAKRRAKAMGDTPEEQTAVLSRIAAQPQFDKPHVVESNAAMSNPRPCGRE